MKSKVLWITRTAMLLALLLACQSLGAYIPVQLTKQLVTGTLVNCILAVTALTVGMSAGITLAIISPVFAFLLGIAPNLITVVPIMAGNTCFVVLLLLIKKWGQIPALAIAAVTKFAVLYLLVVKLICGIAQGAFMGKKLGDTLLLAPKMLKMLPVMFSWPQLVTALAGGALALSLLPILKKSRQQAG